MTVSAGAMRESIRFERRGSTPDGFGNSDASGDWAPLCGPFSAQLLPILGREEIVVGRLNGVQPYNLTVPFCAATAGVTAADRAVNARTQTPYDITAIDNPDMRKMQLTMLVKSGSAEG